MKKLNKFLTLAALSAIMFGICACRLEAQPYDYNETLGLIISFVGQHKYTADTTGPMLETIIQALIDNDGDEYAEGLKRRLVGYSTLPEINKQVVGLTSDEADLVRILYYTRAAPVPIFITDEQLADYVGPYGGKGQKWVVAERNYWKSDSIRAPLHCLEGFVPEDAATLVDVIACTWYSQGNVVGYPEELPSWASDSMWQIFLEIRETELIQNSVAAKLLVNMGLLDVPTSVDAYFTYSGRADITIYLDPVYWDENDVPDLQRLAFNPYYGPAAGAQLRAMGY